MKYRFHGWWLLFLLMVWMGTPPVSAHAIVLASKPAANSILDNSPATIEISFSEPVVPEFSQIQLLSQAGQLVEVGELMIFEGDPLRLGVTVPALTNGTYLVNWQALSAIDGHTTSGTFPFGIGIPEITGASAQTQTNLVAFNPLTSGGRWLNLTGMALLLGFFVFQLLLWQPLFDIPDLNEVEKKIDWRMKHAGILIALLGGGVALLGNSLTFFNQLINYPSFDFAVWLNTQFGLMWLLRLLCLLLLIGLILPSLLSTLLKKQTISAPFTWLGLILSVAIAISTAIVSHSAALLANTVRATLIDLLHLLAAGIWVGGVVQLAVALRLSQKLPPTQKGWLNLSLILNFSALAATAVGFLLASGSYLAWEHVGNWAAVFSTAYGQTLLIKIGLMLLPLGIAGINLFYLKPRLDAAYDQPESPQSERLYLRFSWLVRIEAVLTLLILLLAGLLTDLQRAKDAPLLKGDAGTASSTQTVDDLEIRLALTPALIGANRFDVYLLDQTGNPVTNATEVSLRFTFLGQSLGSAELPMEQVGEGHYRAEGSNLGVLGPWQLELSVRRPASYDIFAAFRLEVSVTGNVIFMGDQGNQLDELVTFLNQSNGLIAGIALILFAIVWGVMANRAAHKDWQLIPLLIISLIAFWIGGMTLYRFSKDFTPAMFATNPFQPSAESIAQGSTLYETHCLACHGELGKGDGLAASTLSSPPANFAGGHTATHPDGDLFYWIKEGVVDTQMPAFSEQLNDEEIWHLVNYVRRLSYQR